MAPQNRRIVTLRDIGSSDDSSSTEEKNNDTTAFRSSSAKLLSEDRTFQEPGPKNPLAAPFCQPASSKVSTGGIIPLLHISKSDHIPMAEACRQTLERIWKEFEPIIRRRGYNIRSISELCCCGDGLDSQRPRPLKKQSDNVWGYNQTTFVRRRGGGGHHQQTTSHTIHLRLRQPRHHATQLLPWEDVAGTMAHELSHCVHQNHSKAFYQLMEEILEEHATNQLQSMGSAIYGGSGGPLSSAPTPPTLPTTGGQRLGGNNSSAASGKSRLVDAGTSSSSPAGGGGYRLSNGSARTPLTPKARREAMARAAETRRKQMEQLRRMIEASKEPCVIEILDDDDDPDDTCNDGFVPDAKPRATTRRDEGKLKVVRPLNTHVDDDSVVVDMTASTPRATKKPKAAAQEPATIDLTSPDIILHRPPAAHPAASSAIPIAATYNDDDSDNQEWECSRCTFHNRSLALVCDMCHGERKTKVQRDKTGSPIEID